MDPIDNPYSPGSGRKPAALVGRDVNIDAWRAAILRAERGVTESPSVLYGRRGVGKTVLLAEFRSIAEDAGWVTAKIETDSDSSLREQVGEALYEPLSDLVRPGLGKKMLKAFKTAMSFKASYTSEGAWTFGLDLKDVTGGGADTGALETDLRKLIRDLTAAAGEEENLRGVALLIDEAQDLQIAELATLAVIAHTASQEGWPFVLAMAGLPSLPRVLSEARSYAERFDYHLIEELDPVEAREALSDPAARLGVEWTAEALDAVVDAAGRYPYFIQQFGKDTWDAAEGPSITRRDAEVGIELGTRLLDNGFFRARWDRATKGERDYLRAIAAEGDSSSTAAVAARMGKSPKSLGPARANLISKGLVFAPDHGKVAFTVPGMASFIDRQMT